VSGGLLLDTTVLIRVLARLLIAQALYEDLTIVTSDEQIQKHKVRTLW
jgi:PIN domain nuclease of toxin-antitoxin system